MVEVFNRYFPQSISCSAIPSEHLVRIFTNPQIFVLKRQKEAPLKNRPHLDGKVRLIQLEQDSKITYLSIHNADNFISM